jgi:hypothetical protein
MHPSHRHVSRDDKPRQCMHLTASDHQITRPRLHQMLVWQDPLNHGILAFSKLWIPLGRTVNAIIQFASEL